MTAKAFVAVSTLVAGMAGLYLKIDYSGWVLFVGLLAVGFGEFD